MGNLSSGSLAATVKWRTAVYGRNLARKSCPKQKKKKKFQSCKPPWHHMFRQVHPFGVLDRSFLHTDLCIHSVCRLPVPHMCVDCKQSKSVANVHPSLCRFFPSHLDVKCKRHACFATWRKSSGTWALQLSLMFGPHAWEAQNCCAT